MKYFTGIVLIATGYVVLAFAFGWKGAFGFALLQLGQAACKE